MYKCFFITVPATLIALRESIKLEDAFLQFNSIFNLPVDLTIGVFQASDSLFKRELRLERNDYGIFGTRVGLMPSNLTYDCGHVLTWHAPAELDIVAQVLNGIGIDPAENDSFDNGAFKNTATVNCLLARNLRLLGELAHDLDTTADRLTACLITAF